MKAIGEFVFDILFNNNKNREIPTFVFTAVTF